MASALREIISFAEEWLYYQEEDFGNEVTAGQIEALEAVGVLVGKELSPYFKRRKEATNKEID